MIELRLSKETERVKSEFLQWLAANPPPREVGRVNLKDFVEISTEWQRRLASERWVGVHWPEAYGGRGLTIVEEAVIQGELARARSPQLIGLFGLTMVGPVLIRYGSEAHRERFLKRILTAEDLWCQGFSEPGAGSDLGSVKTELRPVDGNWSVRGQKIWTSFAQYAGWCFVLGRSDPAAQKHKGLSYLLVEMNSPGIDVRPLTQISGDQEFNEVFFDDVVVPGENLVGAPGQGWEIAISTLMYERVVLTFARHLQSEEALEEIRELLRQRGASSEERREFGRLVAKSMSVRALALSHLVTYSDTNPPGPEGSLDKLGWSETFQEITSFALELLGAEGILEDEAARLQHRYLYSRGRTIAAGTSEIQRNIIAERILKLPRG